MSQVRLDASESIFFSRQLESIDDRLYEVKFPLLKARTLLPLITNVGEWDTEYTYRMYETVGKAKILGDKATDLPTAEVKASEVTTRIKNLASQFSYTVPEIKAAMAKGIPLDDFDARAARRAIAELEDTLLAFGSSADNMKGFANDANVDDSTFSPTDKGGGNTEWSTAGADPLKILADLNNIVNQVWSALKEAQGLPDKITVVLPSPQYALIASMPVSTLATKSVLSYALENNPLLETVVPWHKLVGAGSGPSDRMIAYVRDSMVCGALVPLDFMRQPEQMRGLNFDVPCMSRCGGAVIRYPVAVAYGDGI